MHAGTVFCLKGEGCLGNGEGREDAGRDAAAVRVLNEPNDDLARSLLEWAARVCGSERPIEPARRAIDAADGCSVVGCWIRWGSDFCVDAPKSLDIDQGSQVQHGVHRCPVS